jgi:Protein of unknown function (DUF3168)
VPSPTLASQSAIIAYLRNDATLASLVTGIYVSTPQDQDYNFVTIDSWTVQDAGENDSPGCDSTFVVHSWTRDTGNVLSEKILSRVYDLLHESEGDFTITGFQGVVIRFVSAVSMLDPDGRTFHGAATYRIITTPQP